MAKVVPLVDARNRELHNCAVHRDWLREFTSSRVPPDWTTQDVVTRIVIPETQALGCRYVDILPKGTQADASTDAVSKSDIFVSHVWKNRWHDTVDRTLETLSSLEEGTGLYGTKYIWFDIFAVNQVNKGNQAQDLMNLKKVISNSSNGVMVAIDEEGTIFNRAWCVYEMFQLSKCIDVMDQYEKVLTGRTCGTYPLIKWCSDMDGFRIIYTCCWGCCLCFCCNLCLQLCCQCCVPFDLEGSEMTRPKFYVAGASRLTLERIEALDVEHCVATVESDRDMILNELRSWKPVSDSLQNTPALHAVNANIRGALMSFKRAEEGGAWEKGCCL